MRDSHKDALQYAVVGSGASISLRSRDSESLTFVLLNRDSGKVFRDDLLLFLQESSFVSELLLIEKNAQHVDWDHYCTRYSKLKVLLVREELSVGHCVNLGIQEARSATVFVLWSDMQFLNPFWVATVLFELKKEKTLCVVPFLYNNRTEALPTMHVPSSYEGSLEILSLMPEESKRHVLFPHDFCGLYDRQSFLAMGGYDTHMKNIFWQKADFGLRSYLWGESIKVCPRLRLRYLSEYPIEETSQDGDYLTFVLKNALPRFYGDHAEIPFFKFWTYWRQRNNGFFYGLWRYWQIQKWLKRYRYRFKKDLKYVLELWDNDEIFSL